MAKIFVAGIKLAAGIHADGGGENTVRQVLSADVLTVTTVTPGPAIGSGATAFLVKAITGNVMVAWAPSTASAPTALADPENAANQMLVMEGEAEIIPAPGGHQISLIEVSG